MKQIPSFIGWLLVICGLGLYIFGCSEAIYVSFNYKEGVKPQIPEALDIMISNMGAILLTNLGAILGISITNPTSALASKALFQKSDTKVITPPMNSKELIQYIGLIVFLLVLFSFFIAWAIKDFKSDPEVIVSLIPQSAKTLLGVVSAYLAFVLGANKA